MDKMPPNRLILRLYTGGLAPLLGRLILLLTTTGRKSGLPRITDFLELRLRRHPRMVGKILQMEGLPSRPTRSQLEEYARRLAMVIIHPKRKL